MPTANKNLSFCARLGFAWAGLAHALRTERSVRTQALALLLMILAMLILRPGAVWCGLVILASAGVIAAELFNTAIEQLSDHLHPSEHAAIRIVKDCCAAGVLIMVLGALGVAAALGVEMLHR